MNVPVFDQFELPLIEYCVVPVPAIDATTICPSSIPQSEGLVGVTLTNEGNVGAVIISSAADTSQEPLIFLTRI